MGESGLGGEGERIKDRWPCACADADCDSGYDLDCRIKLMQDRDAASYSSRKVILMSRPIRKRLRRINIVYYAIIAYVDMWQRWHRQVSPVVN